MKTHVCLPIIIFGLLLASFSSEAQMSDQLYQALSDSVKPKDRRHPTLKEWEAVLHDYYSVSPALREELVIWAQFWGGRSWRIKDFNARASMLNRLSWFWYQRTLPDSVDKYSKLALMEAHLHPSISNDKVGYARKMQGYLKIDRGNFSGAYVDLQAAIELFRSVSEYGQISDCLSGLLMIYQKLMLHDRVITTADSTLGFVMQHVGTSFSKHLRPYLLLTKARAHIAKYGIERDERSARAAARILDQVVQQRDSVVQRWRIEAFTERARLSFEQRKYQEAVNFADSAFALEKPSIMENTGPEVRKIFKGMALLEMGQTSNGVAMLKSVNPENSGEYKGILLSKLYEYESAISHFSEALCYQIELGQYLRENEVLSHRGKVFELEWSNKALRKDVEIGYLRANELQTRLMAGAGLGVLGIFGAFQWNRRRHARRQAKALLDQLDEMTEIQTIRIEDIEERLRIRIARDLHDDFSASIAASTQFLQARAVAEKDPADRQKFLTMVNVLQESYQKARSLSHQIYSEGEVQFWDRLSDHIKMFFSGSQMKLDMMIEPEGVILPPEVKVAILLIVKEAIINIIKHAQATSVQISIAGAEDRVVVEILDNGKGLTGMQKKGLGLDSLRARVNELDGTFSFSDRLGGGAALAVSFPV